MVLIFFFCFQSLKHVSKILKFQNYEPVHFLSDAFSVALIDERAESNKKDRIKFQTWGNQMYLSFCHKMHFCFLWGWICLKNLKEN